MNSARQNHLEAVWKFCPRATTDDHVREGVVGEIARPGQHIDLEARARRVLQLTAS
jgi:hypothetical protein